MTDRISPSNFEGVARERDGVVYMKYVAERRRGSLYTMWLAKRDRVVYLRIENYPR